MDKLQGYRAAEAARRKAAMVDGKHYTAYTAEVKALRKAGNDDAAAGLLIRIIEAIERESAIPLAGHTAVAPWYFDQLAIIYRKAGNPEAAGKIKQRYFIADAQATKSGTLALLAMREAAAAGPPAPARRRQAPARSAARSAVQLGKALGLVAGSLLKALGKAGSKRRR